MIRINLLPKELQQAARTPVKLFITVVVGIVMVMVTAFTYGIFWFDTMVLAERAQSKKEEVEHLKTSAAEVDSLLDDIDDYKQRERAIISIKTNRILWSKKLDELVQITPNYIWIIRLHAKEFADDNVETFQDLTVDSGGYLHMICFSSGREVNRITNFRQRLKNIDEFYMKFIEEPIRMENFYNDFINITRPEWKLVMLNAYKDPYNLKFSVRLDLRTLDEFAAEVGTGAGGGTRS
jgi:Tfp pilus assembly protein PilN